MFEVGDIVKVRDDAPKNNWTCDMDCYVDQEMVVIYVDLCGVRVEENNWFWNNENIEKVGHVFAFERKKFNEALQKGKEEAVEYLLISDLRGADLRGAHLSGADLRYAHLSGADLSDAHLSGADLRYAHLSGADLRYADLSGADLSDADLSDADLSGADLSDADLSGAHLSGANLTHTDLSDASLLHTYLGRANLRGANLRGASLSGANLSDADLSDANLSRANLSGASLTHTDLGGANLSGTEGLLDAINYLEANFERTEEGYIVYKTFNSNYYAPEHWKIKPGEIISEVCNPDRTCECGCGINVAPYQWVNRKQSGEIYKLLIRFEWLSGVIVPFGTDGKIRCSRAQIIGKA